MKLAKRGTSHFAAKCGEIVAVTTRSDTADAPTRATVRFNPSKLLRTPGNICAPASVRTTARFSRRKSFTPSLVSSARIW